MYLLTLITNVAITGYFLQREIQRVNNTTRTEALTPHDTFKLDKPERVPFVITQPFVPSHSLFILTSTFTFLFHPPPRFYNVLKAAPIVA